MRKQLVVFNKELTRRFFVCLFVYNDSHILGHLTYFIHTNIIHKKILKSLWYNVKCIGKLFCSKLNSDFYSFEMYTYTFPDLKRKKIYNHLYLFPPFFPAFLSSFLSSIYLSPHNLFTHRNTFFYVIQVFKKVSWALKFSRSNYIMIYFVL